MIQAPLALLRFESRLLTCTVMDPANGNAAVNLTTLHGGATLIEFQIKSRPGAADPPALTKGIGTGITVLTQSGPTLGQFTIALSPADYSTVQAGIYWCDVVVQFTDGTRIYVYKPTQMVIKDVVNFL